MSTAMSVIRKMKMKMKKGLAKLSQCRLEVPCRGSIKLLQQKAIVDLSVHGGASCGASCTDLCGRQESMFALCPLLLLLVPHPLARRNVGFAAQAARPIRPPRTADVANRETRRERSFEEILDVVSL